MTKPPPLIHGAIAVVPTISVEGTANGSASGAFTPQGVVVGHYDGVVAIRFGMDGDCSGVCG
jgi:hypothetical protein